MLKRSLISAGVLGAFVVLAFGSGDMDSSDFSDIGSTPVVASGGGGGGNHAACVAYIEHFNSLSCLPASANQDAATMCPESLDSVPTDMASYYDCMREKTSCDGAMLKSASGTDCPQPGM